MIIRRLVLTVVLVMFAAVTAGVIIGLDDAARSELVSRLPSTSATAADPSVRAERSSTPSATTVTPTPSPSTPSTATARTTPQPTPKPAPPKPAPTKSPVTKAPATKTAPQQTNEKASEKKSSEKKAKKVSSKEAKKRAAEAARYLQGPLKKGRGGTVYLTFDDGPSPYTAQILSVLSRTKSTATFFHLGVNEGGFPHADARIRAQGSKVADHSYNHPDLTRLSAAQLRWQLRHGPKAKCFRPPYGATNSTVRAAIAKAGMRQVLWSTDTLDWTRPGTAKLAKTGRLKSVQNGSIVLMHDGGGDRSQTVAALPTIIADLQARGFVVRALPYC